MIRYWGRHVFGLAAVLFGILTLAWQDFNNWQQIAPLGNVPHRDILACIVGIIEIAGGIAIQRQKTAQVGAVALGAIYLIFALLWVPLGLRQPVTFDPWSNVFENFSGVAGALIVYAAFDRDARRAARISRFGYLSFGVCVVSFVFGQLPLAGTAHLVPKWLPPSRMFWAATTTVAFALAAIALLTGRFALLAARLTTAMIMGFGLLVWLPAPFTKPFADQHINLAGNAENLAIAGAAWIVADYLSVTWRRPAGIPL